MLAGLVLRRRERLRVGLMMCVTLEDVSFLLVMLLTCGLTTLFPVLLSSITRTADGRGFFGFL